MALNWEPPYGTEDLLLTMDNKRPDQQVILQVWPAGSRLRMPACVPGCPAMVPAIVPHGPTIGLIAERPGKGEDSIYFKHSSAARCS